MNGVPCSVCGEIESKGWPPNLKGFTSDCAKCPLCGHIVMYINVTDLDTMVSTGTPEWVSKLSASGKVA